MGIVYKAARVMEVSLRQEKEGLLAEAVQAKSTAEDARRLADDHLYLHRIALADRELAAGNTLAAKDILCSDLDSRPDPSK